MALKKTLAHVLYLAPMAVLLFYPYLSAYGSESWALIGRDLKPSVWATAVIQHYLLATALILALIQGLKAGRSGRSVRLLAFGVALTMILVRLNLGDASINKSLTFLFPVALAAVLAVSVARNMAAAAPAEVQERGLKTLRDLSWLLFSLNALLLSGCNFIILQLNTDPDIIESADSILVGQLLYWLMAAAIVQAVWRIAAFNRLCLSAAVLLTLVNSWALIEAALAPTVNLLIFYTSINSVFLFIMIGFGWATLIWALVYLGRDLKKGAGTEAASRPAADLKPLRALAAAVSLAALLLAGLLFYGVYAPSRSLVPAAEIEPLPPNIEFKANYRIGPVSVRVPEEIIIGRKAWDVYFTDGDQAPLIMNEARFASPEKAAEDYKSASQMRSGSENYVLDDRADLSEFDGFSPVLIFSYDTDPKPSAKPADMLKMTLHLRLDEGYLSISSRLPYLPDSDSPGRPNIFFERDEDFEGRQALIFLKRAKDLLAAYHWTGANEGPGYITRFGWIDPGLIPPSKLSSQAVFTYVNQGEVGWNHCRFVVSIDHNRPLREQVRSDPSNVAILSTSLKGSWLLQPLMSSLKGDYHYSPQTVAGLPGLEYWSYEDRSGLFLDWVSEESDQESSRPQHQLNLRLAAANLEGTRTDQDLWFSLWHEFLKGVKFDPDYLNSAE